MSPLENYRKSKNEAFRAELESPLTADQRREFKGLQYYPENPALKLTVSIDEYPEQKIVLMQTSTGSVKEYVQYGQFTFDVNGQAATLQVYQDLERNYYFLPFVDATSPEETYGAGRYLDLEPAPDGKFVVDFNYAYNPYCAYNDNWTCPIPPKENRISVRIEAGEKNFKAADH
ncbi:MAG TPA: DUF1684 domain-containing protein [Anaerolineae bacterium]|nr:DUF1684 domain-containing protein [Anaerolineae bacterium]